MKRNSERKTGRHRGWKEKTFFFKRENFKCPQFGFELGGLHTLTLQ